MSKLCIILGRILRAADCQSTSILMLFPLLLIGLCLPVQAKPLCIVVAGDCRADFPWNKKRPGDKDGINEDIIREIAAAIAKDDADPKIMLWTGDMVNINESAGPNAADKTKSLENGLNKWRAIMDEYFKDKETKETKVTVLPVRGNHEVEWYEEKDRSPSELVGATKIWNEVFPLPSDIPPANHTDHGTTFAYATGPVLCVGLDQYENRRHLIHQQWLNGVLRNNKKPFVFTFCHEPMFVTGGNHTREDTLAAYPHYRDEMLKSLQAAGARVFLCGHDHFYDHMVVRKAWTPIGAEMHQLTAGTAGAPYYTRQSGYPPDEDWQLEQVKHSDLVYGYVRILIEENTAPKEDTATIEFKARQPEDKSYQVIDRFKYSVKLP
jgi:Calcineurin-like phosphoesterase